MVLVAASYTSAITNLKSVLLTLGSAIGAVMLVYGGIKFAMAFRTMDQQGEHQGVYSVESCRDSQRSHVYSGSSDLPVRIPVVSDGADHHAVVPQA